MPIIELLGPHGHRLQIDHVIYNRMIWSAKSPNGRYYSGVHPHYDHLHIGFNKIGAANVNYATLVAVLGDPQGDDVTPEAEAFWQEVFDDLQKLEPKTSAAWARTLIEDFLWIVQLFVPDLDIPIGIEGALVTIVGYIIPNPAA
jgi:hypothetical protein